jgi:putative transposase
MNYKRYFIPNSMVFITIVTYNRKDFLLDYIDLIKSSLKYTKTKISFKIEAIVILKDHIHFILQLENINDYPNIIKYFKTYFSRNINIDNSDLTEGKKHKKEKGIWQSRYWAHIILDENDLNKHIDYIHFNPMKHYNIAPKDWEYSSFKKYVNNKFYNINWCNFNDKYKIAELDLE